jgi:crotonobetainyl-CoA:carnitine CoA-transferase CaiB-like acyl-CoA transferase
MTPPLRGLRVLELADGLCGPQCGMQLSDAGAEVVKVEPVEGDYARQMGTPFVDGVGASFLTINRGKRGIAVDLAHREAPGLIKRLADRADVVIESFGERRAKALGLDYAALSDGHPRLVYASITPFGSKGPLKDHQGSELVAQAMSDYLGSLGSLDAPPLRLGADVAATNTASMTTHAILAALLHRQKTGQGQQVGTSYLGTLMNMRGIMWAAMSDPDDWYGFHNETYIKPPEKGYRTKTAPVSFRLGRGDSERWDELLIRLDMLDVLEDERFANGGREATGSGRYAYQVKERWEQAFVDMTADEVVDLIREVGGDAIAFNDYDALTHHPQVEELGLIQQVPLGNGGSMPVAAWPVSMSETPCAVQGPPPALGVHTDAVLGEAGYSTDEIARMRAAGLVR